ncbi:HD domain-containing protein [Actinoplanes sp. NBRC 103695]|uniref:HD domain-containing protein n=1 Tax=Actinoplanes sp. NBRC 103695 TaxID=3032202 RepID=UPI002555A06B|nr:HD domain-containing protein [Actinoplanes sp. NBRC 103695]
MLERALTEPPLRALPADAAALLRELNAPPRLAAHLRAVHDVAVELVDWLAAHHPAAAFDRRAVLFGAATHDIGKTVHPEELSAPGSRHERAGQKVLLDLGFEPRLARFAATHASWTAPGLELDDLIVSLADKVWKARRVADLEDLVVGSLAGASGREPWAVFLGLDEHLERLGSGADSRLAFQNDYSTSAARRSGEARSGAAVPCVAARRELRSAWAAAEGGRSGG